MVTLPNSNSYRCKPKLRQLQLAGLASCFVGLVIITGCDVPFGARVTNRLAEPVRVRAYAGERFQQDAPRAQVRLAPLETDYVTTMAEPGRPATATLDARTESGRLVFCRVFRYQAASKEGMDFVVDIVDGELNCPGVSGSSGSPAAR
jgi:hypothetical protein